MRRMVTTVLLSSLFAGSVLFADAAPSAGQPATSGQQARGATVTVTGLDAAIEALRPREGRGASREQAGLVTALSILQLVGQAPRGTTDTGTRSYVIESTADGRVLINGTDLGPLVRMFELQSGR